MACLKVVDGSWGPKLQGSIICQLTPTVPDPCKCLLYVGCMPLKEVKNCHGVGPCLYLVLGLLMQPIKAFEHLRACRRNWILAPAEAEGLCKRTVGRSGCVPDVALPHVLPSYCEFQLAMTLRYHAGKLDPNQNLMI